MKLTQLALTIWSLFTLSAFCSADEPPKYVSATFQEILGRVESREKESGAIMTVKPRADAPRLGFGLRFSLVKEKDGDTISLSLERRWMTHIDVFERYLLRIDDAIREELGKQEKLRLLTIERERQYLEAGKQHIDKLLQGKLHAGMSREEVEKVIGKPEALESAQAAGYLSMIYPGFTLYFHPSGLVDAVARKEPLNP